MPFVVSSGIFVMISVHDHEDIWRDSFDVAQKAEFGARLVIDIWIRRSCARECEDLEQSGEGQVKIVVHQISLIFACLM